MIMFIGMINLSVAQTQEQTVSIPVSQLTEQQKQTINTQQTVQTASQWVGLGKEIGEAFNGALSALTKNASDFATTDLGRFAMFMVAFKIIGPIIIGTVLWLLITIILSFFYYSYIRKNVFNRTEIEFEKLDDKGKVIERTYTENRNKDNDGGVFATIIYLVSVSIISAIIFVNCF